MRFRLLESFPTWGDAWESAAEDEMYRQCMPADHRDPEPTVIGTWLGLTFYWLRHHLKNWRCVVGPHFWGKWNNLENGRVRTCARCGTQHGQGEY